MNARAIVVVALVLAGLVLTAGTFRRRQMQRRLADQIYAVDRHVDAYVRLRVVVQDDNGTEYLPGKPKLRIVRTHEFGGWIDTKTTPPRLLTAGEKPFGPGRDWYCSEDQEPVILHSKGAPPGSLTLGGMGAGKTTAGVMWLYLRWLENLGVRKCEGAITAPTNDRLAVVFDEIKGTWPASWYHHRIADHMLVMCDGTRIRGLSTSKPSASQGSRIQGFNWWFWLGDELQDQLDEFVNIQARLRGIGDGSEKRLGTVTAKDDPRWRTFLDQRRDDPFWVMHSMLGPNSPFKHASHWATIRASTTERDYRRLVLAEDLPAESRVYSGFDRKRNVRPVPLVGARKITSIVLSRKTGDKRDAIGIGHDPGTAKAGSVWLDAYELNDRKGEVLWWVRGELFTLHKSAETHAVEAMKITRDRFGCNVRPDSDRAHVRCQPIGQAEDKPDLDVFAIWQRVGFNIKAAQYSKQGQGVGQIKKESRIAVVNTLFEKERLFLESGSNGIVSPQLMSALETMERDHFGRPEHEEKKFKHDKSDLPAALGYFLWPFEKEMALSLRADIGKELRV